MCRLARTLVRERHGGGRAKGEALAGRQARRERQERRADVAHAAPAPAAAGGASGCTVGSIAERGARLPEDAPRRRAARVPSSCRSGRSGR